MTWISGQWNVQRLLWEGRRRSRLFVWRFGWLGVLTLVCLLTSSAALVIEHLLAESARQARSDTAFSQTLQPISSKNEKDDLGGRGIARLQAFDAHLLPHDEIPDTLKNLFSLATDSNLLLARGEYKAQVEEQGRFVRYGMTLPVRGDPQAIHTFVLTSLVQNRTLALESIQFKRERTESQEIEARIQWVLLTRLRTSSAAFSGSDGSGSFE